MPDVGTLNIRIESDAESAAKGLSSLASALGRVQKAIGTGINLSGVSTALSTLNTAVTDNKALANIGTFLNAIGTYADALKKLQKDTKGVAQIDTNPIVKIQEALKDGIKIGNAGTQLGKLREALAGEWSTTGAEDASAALETLAEGVKAIGSSGITSAANGVAKLSKALGDLNKSTKGISKIPGITDFLNANMSSQAVKSISEYKSIGENITKGMEEGIRSGESGPVAASVEAAKKTAAGAREELGIESPSRVFFVIGEFTMEGLIKGIESKSGDVTAAIRQVMGDMKSAGETAGNWRDSMYGGTGSKADAPVANINISGLKEAIETLNNFKITKTKGANVEALANAIDHLKRVTIGGIPLTAMINSIGRLNEKAGELGSSGTISALHDLAEALRMVKENAEGMQLNNVKINFGSGRSRSKSATGSMDAVGQVMQETVKETEVSFTNMEQTVQGVRQGVEEVTNDIIQLNNVGQNATEEAERMARAFAYMFEVASKMRSAMSLPEHGFVFGEGTVSGDDGIQRIENVARIANETRDIILYNENMENSWENISARIESAKRELDAYFASQKQVIFGNESIKGIYEDVRFGPTLAGFYGSGAQANMIEQISNGTGLSVKNIVDQLYELSNGTINLKKAFEETVSGGSLDSVKEKIASVGTMSEEAVSKIDLLGKKIQFIREKMDFRSFQLKSRGMDPEQDSAINNYKLQILGLYDQINKIIDKALEAQEALKFNQLKSEAAEQIVPWQMQDVDNLVNQYSEIDLLTMKMEGMKQALVDDINQNKLDIQQIAERTMAIQKLRDKIEELTKAQEGATAETKKLKSEHVTLASVMKSMFPTLSGLKKRFIGMTISRSIRYVIRQIASGFSEGIQNVYQYSKAIGTTLAPAMDTAATAIAQMKNSLGAAAAPVIQALVPVLQTVVNWFITAINYVNQFFALLNGQKTWTRALPKTVEAFDKQEKGAKKASAAMKDLLADWDELNIIQSQGGGGGGVGSDNKAEEYLEMFEEVGRFDNKVKDVVNFVKDNFEVIKTIAEGIGAAILAWRLSSAFGKELGMLQKLELAAGLTLLITGLKISASAGYDIGKNGINGKNVPQAVLGVLSGMGGGALIGFSLAGVPGAIIGATVGALLTLTVTALAIHKGEADALYGDVTKDVDEIRADLEKNVLSPEATITLDVLKAQLSDVPTAESKVQTALNDLSKSYPIDVTITPDSASEFKKKIDTLVDSTNLLINESSETLKELHVPATAVFTEDFVDKAWGNVSRYVTDLGKKIGDELDKGITDNVRLDELRKKLENISKAVLTATKSSEFSGKVGMAGGKAREDNFANYDRQTIQNYIDEYNKLTSETMSDAIGYAQADYTEMKRLIAALEQEIQDGAGELSDEKLAELNDELKTARDELIKSFGLNGEKINEYAKKLFDEWTQAGSSLYARDISGALSTAISKNKYKQSYYNMALDNTLPNQREFENAKNKDRWVEHYINQQNNELVKIIAKASEMPLESIQKLLDNTGINPLSLLDKSFVTDYQNKIMSWLLDTKKLSTSQKENILGAFGLSIVDLNNYAKEVKKHAEEAKKEAEEVAKVKKAQEEADKQTRQSSAQQAVNQAVEDNILTPYEENLLGAQFGADVVQGIKDSIPEDPVPFPVIPVMEVDLEDLVREALNNTDLDAIQLSAELDWLGGKYGYDAVEKILQKLEQDNQGNTGYVASPAATSGSATPYTRWTPTATGNGQEVEVDFAGMTNSVEKGTQAANQAVVSGLRDIVVGIQRLLGKEFVVNITPTSGLGRTVGQAQNNYGKVTGDFVG